VQPQTDVFSLGLVLFEMITGRHAFEAESTIALLHGIQKGPAPPSGAGADLDRLLCEMLQKQPSLRPGASEVSARLAGAPAQSHDVSLVRPMRTTVGRARERAELRAAFETGARGAGRFVAVAGEPGIGKSTLVADFLSEIETPAWMATGRCSERLAGAEARLPFLEALEGLVRRDPGVVTLVKRFAPGWFAQIAPASTGMPPGADAAGGSADRLMREMIALLRELARSRPVVLFLDDVHWADLSTLDLLRSLAENLTQLRVLVVVTYRPADLTLHKHPFLHLKSDLLAHGLLRELPVAFLEQADVAEYVSAQLADVPPGIAERVFRKTEGNALFMADLVRYLQERGSAADLASEIERNVPESLRGMIDRKLEGLSEEERQLLRIAAIQGVQFDSAIVAQVLSQDPADTEDLLQSLDRVHGLVQLLRERELPSRLFSLRYQFVHVLYQGALYGSLSPSRAASWSGKVAAALEAAHGDRKAAVASELALLYEMARDPWRASQHFLAASEVASGRFATREAVMFARRGLACLAAVPDSEEARRRELALQKALRVPLAILEGYGTPGTEMVSDRVIALSEQLADHESLFAALDGAFLVHMVRGECVAAADISERMISVAGQSGNEAQQMLARTWAMIARHHLGDLAASQHHADICIEMGTPANQASRLISILDPVVAALAESSRNLWMMGDADGCLDRTRRALQLARDIKHPDSLSFALLFYGWMHGHCADWQTCLSASAEAIALGNEHSLVQTMAWNHCVHGWAIAHLGQESAGLAELETGIAASTKIMGEIAMPHFIAMLAEVLIRRNDHERALGEVQRILKRNETSRDKYFNAELHRLAAECQLALGDASAAGASLRLAIDTARAQGATRFEQRAVAAMEVVDGGRSGR
jgi:predicted ATPase